MASAGRDQALAQSVSKPKPVDGRKTVISGIKSYEAGRLDKAVSTLTKAISAVVCPHRIWPRRFITAAWLIRNQTNRRRPSRI